jgi:site-specific recombinase XerD
MTTSAMVSEFFRTHLTREHGFSPNTVAAYAEGVRQLLAYAADRLRSEVHDLDLAAFDVALFSGFLDHLEKNRSIATRNLRLSAIRHLFRHLAGRDPRMLAAADAVASLPAKRAPEPVMPALTKDQVQAFLALAAGHANPLIAARDRALLQLLYNTGGRASEIVSLDWTHLTVGTAPVITLTGKGGRTRVVPLWPETVAALDAYRELRARRGIDHPILFLNPQRRRLTRFGLRHIVRRYARLGSVRPAEPGARPVTAHTFRHTTAFHMLRATSDIVAVKDWLGHRDINTTSRYCHVDPETKRRALNTFRPPLSTPPAARWKQPDLMRLLEQLTHATQASTLCEAKPTFPQTVLSQPRQNFT